MTLREALPMLGALPPAINYGRIGETDHAVISVFDTENNHGPRYGFAVYMREGFLARQTSPQFKTEARAMKAVEDQWGPGVEWHERTPEQFS